MAKGSHRRPDKRKKKNSKNSDELRSFQRLKDREKFDRKTKNLTIQLRGKKWDPEEYIEELEDEMSDL